MQRGWGTHEIPPSLQVLLSCLELERCGRPAKRHDMSSSSYCPSRDSEKTAQFPGFGLGFRSPFVVSWANYLLLVSGVVYLGTSKQMMIRRFAQIRDRSLTRPLRRTSHGTSQRRGCWAELLASRATLRHLNMPLASSRR